MAFAILSATCNTKLKSADPSALCGVPTAIKQTSAFLTADSKSVENDNLLSVTFDFINSSSPGS